MVKERLRDLARLYLPVYQIESGPMKVIYAGYSSIKRNYYIRTLSCEESKKTYLGRRWFWQIPAYLKLKNCSMVISEISRITLNRFQRYEGFILPEWTKMLINIDRPMSEIMSSNGTNISDVIRLTRKYDLTYELLTDKESLRFFYEKFYLPYITKRHKSEAFIIDFNLLWNPLLKPFLLTIKENGLMVGAGLCKGSANTLDLVIVGLLDGNEEYRRHGVIGAIYYYLIVEGQKRGAKFIDVGGSHPFINDGLTKYKMGLGAEFETDGNSWDPGQGHWLGVNKGSPIAMDFIKNNSFIFLDKDHMAIWSPRKQNKID
jgi:hypothetical protein